MTWTGVLILAFAVLFLGIHLTDREVRATQQIMAALYRWPASHLGLSRVRLYAAAGKPLMFAAALSYLRERGLVMATGQDEQQGDLFTLTPRGRDEAEMLVHHSELGA